MAQRDEIIKKAARYLWAKADGKTPDWYELFLRELLDKVSSCGNVGLDERDERDDDETGRGAG